MYEVDNNAIQYMYIYLGKNYQCCYSCVHWLLKFTTVTNSWKVVLYLLATNSQLTQA